MKQRQMSAPWRAVFGHAEPYDDQVDGIETAIETARNDGFTVVEGACGTGKTMLALTAGINLVRDPDSDYERVLVLTSVKQQLRQFEEDLETINTNLPADWDPVSGLTLVGKSDVCPYNRENAGGIDDGNVYDRCDTLREKTRDLTGEGGDTTAEALTAVARSQQIDLASSGAGGGAASYLESAGEPSPYPRTMPEYDTGTTDIEFCPFYARFLADMPDDGDPAEAVPFDFSDAGLLRPDDLVGKGMEYGTCPHSLMGVLLAHAEVVVGNYYHAFDPTTTSSFTGPLLDDSTFLVCDEAHMLEPRVRDLVSDGVADRTLRDAEAELTRVIQPVAFSEGRGTTSRQTTADADLVRGELNDTDIEVSDLEHARDFVVDLREELDRRVTAHLDREHRGWKSDLNDLPDAEIPLRDPEHPAPDEITEWAEAAGYDGRTWTDLPDIAAVTARVLNEAEDEEKSRAVESMARALSAWFHRDHTEYFREIELERTWDDMEPVDSWRRAYNARLAIQNCVPSSVIADHLAEFGGGVLMSATLAPIDIFAEVTGLNHLEKEGRPVEQRTYGLHFPEENRESFAVAAPKYTYDNRGDAGEENRVRQTYIDAICSVASSPGNVLVGMPNYYEAEWAAEQCRRRLDKEVLLDESSADSTTEDLKDEFFAGEGKVLVTSLRGTLTEGVDYKGDRLSAAVVCGVPLINTASPRTRAVRKAYDEKFGDGFEYALTVPAVRKARQAIGRVIRGPEEVGVRVFVDERYARESWDSVREYLPEPEREEFQPVSPDMLDFGLERFWSQQ
ncbi:ATP-dependent DNA helicase [Haloarchaeobius sp. TZWSO28]|uniref:ATP-dependent DNA helicase n=1 Tax=Haloarchaeobius sp. TZWSO28 TaxID=3446119 RepID=UPI003EBA4DAC